MLATQCLLTKKSKSMQMRVEGRCRAGVTAKDLALAMIGRIGTAGGTGYAIEFAGERDPRAVDGRPDDGVQHGDRGGRARRHGRRRRQHDRLPAAAARSRPSGELWDRAVAHWRTLTSDEGAKFDTCRRDRRGDGRAAGHVGHVAGDGRVDRGRVPDPDQRSATRRGARAWSARSRTWDSRRTRRSTDIAHRQGVHRLVHEFAHRGPARRRGASRAAVASPATSSSRWSCRARGR